MALSEYTLRAAKYQRSPVNEGLYAVCRWLKWFNDGDNEYRIEVKVYGQKGNYVYESYAVFKTKKDEYYGVTFFHPESVKQMENLYAQIAQANANIKTT